MSEKISLSADGHYRNARWAVAIGVAVALAGSLFGLVFGVILGPVSGVEGLLIASCVLVSITLLALLLHKPTEATTRVSALASLYFTAYLSAGIVVTLLHEAQFLRILPYLLWFFALLAFNKFTNFGRFGQQLDAVITLAPPALLITAGAFVWERVQADEIAAFVVFLLSFLSFAFFLNLFSEYRERMAVSIAEAKALAKSADTLRESEERFRRLFDDAGAGIGMLDMQGRLVWTNKVFRALTNLGEGSNQKEFADFLHNQDRAEWLENLESIRNNSLRHFVFGGRLLSPIGRDIYVQSTFVHAPARQSLPEGVTFVCQDVTEQRELEMRLKQSQKLETIGQLTGGVAHDFNNLLTVIVGNTDILRTRLADDPDLRSLADMTAEAAMRGAELTSRLLAFARRHPLDPAPVDINGRVAQLDPLLRRVLGEDIEIEVVRAAGLWPAMVDGAQLESAIVNLCVNARDAMRQGGKLTIETANMHLDDDYVAGQINVAAGQYVMIAVSDTGVGMDADTLARAFEPFFTTKEIGKGSGLGLSMVYGFVKQSNGHVKIYSEPGRGSSVKLYLPRSASAAAASVPRKALAPTRGSGTILVVEDDDLVRTYVTAQLSAFGYTLLTVSNAAAAIDVLRASEPIDLLFTDIVMPGGMDGQQLAKEAKKLRPDLPVLFTSGYTENAIMRHGSPNPGIQLLQKPYRRQDLGAKVAAALQQSKQQTANDVIRRAASGPYHKILRRPF